MRRIIKKKVKKVKNSKMQCSAVLLIALKELFFNALNVKK
jgi:hypothetical protein